MWSDVQFYSAAALVILGAIVGVVLTLVTLPGMWTMLLIALICKAWQPDLLSWWTLGIGAGLAISGELVEFFGSAAGSKHSGGTRAGAWGSVAGALLGAILGTIFLPVPIVGTIVGAVVGAGLGAGVAERGISRRTWGESWKSGHGAAVGRLASVVVKGALSAIVATLLCVDAVWN